jgi:hypothetical protein
MADTGLLILFALGVILVIFVVPILAVRSGRGVTTRAVRSFWCPLLELDVTAEFEEDPWGGKRLDVVRCNAFPGPDDIRCGKACLGLPRLPPRRQRVPAA